MSDSFPRQAARTRRFTLGRPRSFTVGGDVLLFLRSPAGDDPVTDLWKLDLTSGAETLLLSARSVAETDGELTAAERARRERAREAAGGITAYATDDACSVAVCSIGGRLHVVDVATGDVTTPAEEHTGVYDPRVSPDGNRIAFVDEEGVHLVDRVGQPRTLVAGEGVTWGVADFIAAEELQRSRGHWWSPDGERLAVARIDEGPVARWHIADPAHPDREATVHRYPAAGTSNADVGLSVVELEQRRRVDVRWDRDAQPYLLDVLWRPSGELTVVTLDRPQSCTQVHLVDLANGSTEVVAETATDAWIDVVPGAPRWLPDGRLLTVVDDLELGEGGTRTIAVDGRPVGPAGVHVRSVVEADASSATVLASAGDPTERHLATIAFDGDVTWRTTTAGVHGAVQAPAATVVTVALREGGGRTEVRTRTGTHELADHREAPLVTPRPEWLELGPRQLRAALLLPAEQDGPLPLLLDPYGGPHAQRVLGAADAHLTSQWFADQGYAVLVVDGRGTPGRGPAFEHAVRFDLAGPVLEDQMDAVAAVADDERIDTGRVAIRGWSFGGYLAALAALRRPDVVRAAIVGAPVTDWHLYDTAYTERYLGHPDVEPEAYERSSLVDGDGRLLGAVEPPAGQRPPGMLLIHGLADDNVVAAHSLRLSGALLAAGRPHEFLPLSGVTHMTPQEEVAENLMHLQLDFLRRHLG